MTGKENDSNPLVYRIDIIESTDMDLSKVTSSDIDNQLNSIGKIALYGIKFDLNSSKIKVESTPTLMAIANFLRSNPKTNVYVVGHTDAQGNFDNNLNLSQKRAESVVKKLVSEYKISASRLTAKGVAMLSPVSSNETVEGRKLNRRVEIIKK